MSPEELPAFDREHLRHPCTSMTVPTPARLVDLTPAGLDHVFLGGSGSVRVEVTMKMALRYQRDTDRPARTRFVTVRGGYHGDTFDRASVRAPHGGMPPMWSGVLAQQVFGERPPRLDEDVDAGATGFGRAGTLFAAGAADVTPEVLSTGEAASASPELPSAGDWGDVRRINAGWPMLHAIDAAVTRALGAVGMVDHHRTVDTVEATEAAPAPGGWLRPFRDLIHPTAPCVRTGNDIARSCAGIPGAAEVA